MIAVLYSGSKPEFVKKTWFYAFRSRIKLNEITSDGDFRVFKMMSKSHYIFIPSKALLTFMEALGDEAKNIDFVYDEHYE